MTLPLPFSDWRALWRDRVTPESRGAVYTKLAVVDFILDMAGYTASAGNLAAQRVLEPSCGDGAFVTRVVARLIANRGVHAVPQWWADPSLVHALTAVDINSAAVRVARAAVLEQLTAAGCPRARAELLVHEWIFQTDFLLEDFGGRFDLVVGNPPYVRVEDLPRPVLAEYRARFDTMGDRADLFIAFIERGLRLINPRGRLAYIVANRWAKNLYGRRLRQLIAREYHVRSYIDMAHTQPFESDVSAYPAVVVIDRRVGAHTLATSLEDVAPSTLGHVVDEVCNGKDGHHVHRFDNWYPDGSPWVATNATKHYDLERLTRLPTIEESAPETRVGIGVATGADSVFIVTEPPTSLEVDRLLRLAIPSDVRNDRVLWSGHWLINPFAASDDGALVDLHEYPGLAAYLEERGAALRRRHVARNRPHAWYRTIDRVWPTLLKRPKLLMRDIQDPNKPTVGLDRGRYYPHHNLYWITSTGWPLAALQCLLRSRHVVDQVRAHSVQMRGGSVRWQAQVLRRLRVPAYDALSADLLERLSVAGPRAVQQHVDALADEAYGAAGV